MLRTDQLAAPTAVTAALWASIRAAVGIIAELNRRIADLEAELASHFEAHPDADIYLALPGDLVRGGKRLSVQLAGDWGGRATPTQANRRHA